MWGFSAGSLRTLHAFLLPFPVVQAETSMVKEMVNQCQSTFTANSSKYQKVGVSETFHFSRHQRLPLNSCTASQDFQKNNTLIYSSSLSGHHTFRPADPAHVSTTKEIAHLKPLAFHFSPMKWQNSVFELGGLLTCI